MVRRALGIVGLLIVSTAAMTLAPRAATAAPQIDRLSLRGLQAGGVTTLVIEGSELLPEPKVWFTAPLASQTVKEGATPNRLEVDLALDGQTPPGIYLLRVGSASGISLPVAIGVDNLPQLPFAPHLETTNVAVSGELTGSTVLSTTFAGKAGQKLVVDVESLRLGASLNPVVRLYDAEHVQLAWGQSLGSLAGDARLTATLPADATYSIELHDALYRGAAPGFFRLKIGDLQFAELVYPLGAEQSKEASFEFRGGNLPATARASTTWSLAGGRRQAILPTPWPTDLGWLIGPRPGVIVSNHAELLEAEPSYKPQDLTAAPVAINGRIGADGEHDRYRLAVTPGQNLRFDVWAHRAGSPLDGVLSIQNEQGAELAGNDDRAKTCDPGLDFTVPKDVTALIVALRDLQGRGAAEYVYRISALPVGEPDFSLALESERLLIPQNGAALARVVAQRAGYEGPIKLSFDGLPENVSVTGDEIPAGATQTLVTLTAPGLSPSQSIARLWGASVAPATSITQVALPPQNAVMEHSPWLGEEIGVAVTTPAPLTLAWDPFSADVQLAVGAPLAVKLRVNRAEGTAGPVRLSLLTTQVPPRKKVKENNQEREIDDVERTLRFEAAPTIAAEASDADAKVLVPADLPRIAYDLAIQAELLSADGKNVLAAAVTPARRMIATTPLTIELATNDPIEARAGLGETGKLAGKIRRAPGFTLPVTVSLSGLPKGSGAPSIELAADKNDFELPLSLRYGTPLGELKDVKLVATSQLDPKNAETMVKSAEAPVAINVVAGDKPPAEQPRVVFEDQVEFLANLIEGGGQASLVADQKYSGLASIRVTPDQKFNPALPGLNVKIREFPAPGEYRYVQYAWKKQGGQSICLQLNHDGKWGPDGDGQPKFRYHAGSGGEVYGGSIAVDENLPAEFTVVTRDLFADFGEFTLMGLALSPVDGEAGLWDHIYLGTQPEDFDLVKP
ncbi:MAG: hypothetical protein WD845_00080 [Pirellulales bacterium]